ncbi:TadE family protein [Streptomyces sp. NBC_01217]|uniref:TadE family protein n=1 Tax=Streptomyces sp. NBC_01217 TaxID=2903779 RepID=UPI002E12FE64|nr:pilus assembly protein [Streptomyces sp. NBC_01217]
MVITETTDTEIRGRRYGDPSPTGSRIRFRVRGRERDRGQTAIEFLGVTPLIILLMIALWQCALIGYTFSLAGNAADEAAHRGAIAQGLRGQECRNAAEEHLPKAWRDSMKRTTCRTSGGMYEAEVRLQVPVLVPGVLNWPFRVEGDAAFPVEG